MMGLTDVQYLTNEEGQRTAVVLPIAIYEKMMDDLDDIICLRMVEQLEAEQLEDDNTAVPFEQVWSELEEKWAKEKQTTTQSRKKHNGFV